MNRQLTLNVNGKTHQIEVDADTPLLYVLRSHLGLKGPKYGCASEQCNACKVLVDGADVPSCQLPVNHVQGLKVVTLEGLGTDDALHPLQEAFIEEGASQCGYCVSGMIIAAQGLLNRTRYPTDEEIRASLDGNICRCGIYNRVRRAIRLRIGRPDPDPAYQVIRTPIAGGENQPADEHQDLPNSLQRSPELDSWIRFNTDETITVFTGKVEIGQGIKTAVAQIAAEELDVTLKRIKVQTADTMLTPDEGITAGSMSLQISGTAVRYAAAEARYLILAMAFEELNAETPAEALEVCDGTITDPVTGRSTNYWHLVAGQKFGRMIKGLGRPKLTGTHLLVGQGVHRLDLPAKVAGQPSFVHDLELPGMVHGRVVRPPGYDARLLSADLATVGRMPGIIKVVRDGSFIGVVAEEEYQAVRARDALEELCRWQDHSDLIDADSLYDHLQNQPSESYYIKEGTTVDDPFPPIYHPPTSSATLEASYYRPYHMHGSLGPSAAVAQLNDGQMTIWSHSQGVFLLRQSIAHVLAMDPEDIRIIHCEGSGCYGHNGADDAALDAALLARALPGRPVSLKWSRSDEHSWEPYGTAMAIKLRASLNSNGSIDSWNHDIWSYPHTARPRPQGNSSGLMPAWYLDQSFTRPRPQFLMGTHFGSYRNADPLYSLPHKRVAAHFVPNSPLRTSSLRSLGAYANVFAIESFIDELAKAAGADPVEFRLRHLNDHRAIEVIKAAVEKAGIHPAEGTIGTSLGRGIAFARYKNSGCYTAVIADLRVNLKNGEIDLLRATIAADAGQIVNPDGLSSQLEGGFFQSASWTLKEQVRFNNEAITSRDWDSYPVLRFSGSPVINTVLIDRPELPFLGGGEAAQGPAAAAIANAIFAAAGVRVRDLPITPDKVLALL